MIYNDPKLHLERLHAELRRVALELTRTNFSQCYAPRAWTPPINAYRFKNVMRICVELAGVPKDEIQIQVQERRLLIKGHRTPPEPLSDLDETFHVVAMEIDYGPFECEIVLPTAVDIERVTAQQENGYLWIELPFLRRDL